MVCSAPAVVVQLSGPWIVHTLHPGPRPLRSAAVLKGQLKKGPLARGPWQPALPLWILDWETGPGMASIVPPSVSPTPVIIKISLRFGGWLLSWHVADILMGADWDISTPGRVWFLEGLGGEDRGRWENPQSKVWGLPVCWWVLGSWGPGDLTPGWILLLEGDFVPLKLGGWRCSFLSKSSLRSRQLIPCQDVERY